MFRSIIRQKQNTIQKEKCHTGGLFFTINLLRCIDIMPVRGEIKDKTYNV
jgi:hypothetical protein